MWVLAIQKSVFYLVYSSALADKQIIKIIQGAQKGPMHHRLGLMNVPSTDDRSVY